MLQQHTAQLRFRCRQGPGTAACKRYRLPTSQEGAQEGQDTRHGRLATSFVASLHCCEQLQQVRLQR